MKALLILVGMFFSIVCVSNSLAQGTAFTYQGQLAANGFPASGKFDVVFSLCDASNAGDYIGLSVTNDNVSVTNGLFTATLDFGQVFNGAARWLEIGVRTNGASAFITLSPRQQLTPTPYAITASNALTAATITGSLPNSSLTGSYTDPVMLDDPSNTFAGTFTGNGAGLTNLPYAETFSSTNGYFSFAQNPDGSTNVTFIFTNGTPGEVGAQPVNTNLTLLSGNNGGALTNDLRSLAVYVNSNYTVSASELAAMRTTNIVYYVDTDASNILFTFPTPPVPANVIFSIINFGTNSIALTNQPGAMFEIANGYSSVCTNEVTIGGYFDKVMVWQNLNATNWVQLANHRTVQEIRDIAAAYIGITNGMSGNLAVNNNLVINGMVSGNGSGLTNLPFAETFSSTNGFFSYSQNPDGSTNVTFILTNVDARTIAGTLSEAVLPSSAVLTNGASTVGQVPTWNGTNYVWASANGSTNGNVYSNTVVNFNAVNSTNLSATNVFAGSIEVGNTSQAATGIIFNSGPTNTASTNTAWLLSQRYNVNLGYPVASFAPEYTGTNGAMAVDIMPANTPNAVYNVDGFNLTAWLHVCNTNFLSVSPAGAASIVGVDPAGNAYYGACNFGMSNDPDVFFMHSHFGVETTAGYISSGSWYFSVVPQTTVNGGVSLGANPQFGGAFSTVYVTNGMAMGIGPDSYVIQSGIGNVLIKTNALVYNNMTVSNNLTVKGTISANSLTLNGTASIQTNTAHFGTSSESITMGTLFTNLTGGRADFVGQFTFSDPSGGNPILVVSNLTTGLVITNSYSVTSESAMQGVVFPDVSPGDVCEAYDASTDPGASVSFVQGWWIVK